MAAEEGTVANLVTLVSSDGHEFEVAEEVTVVSPTIKRLIEEGLGNRRITLPNITSKILKTVVEFAAEFHNANVDDQDADPEGDNAWGEELDNVDPASVTCLILAADYMEMNGLLAVACKRAAKLMAGRNAEEVQKMFQLKCEVTPAEEAEIKRNNKWAFQ